MQGSRSPEMKQDLRLQIFSIIRPCAIPIPVNHPSQRRCFESG
jgi:hypothetical protein